MTRRKRGTSPFIVLASGDDLEVLPEAGGQRPMRLAGDGAPGAPDESEAPADSAAAQTDDEAAHDAGDA
jgi:hypothetical protein